MIPENEFQKKALATQISDLDLPVRFVRILNKNNIYTVEELINESWGNYTHFRGIGSKSEKVIREAVSKTEVDIEAHLSGTIKILPIPDKIKQFLIREKITHITELKSMETSAFYKIFPYDKNMALQMIHAFEESGIELAFLKDKIIFDTDLSPKTRNILYKAGYHTESKILAATPKQLKCIRNVGQKTIEEIMAWKQKHKSILLPEPPSFSHTSQPQKNL